jgi:hypothetical protein
VSNDANKANEKVDYASTLKPAAVETPLDLLFFRPAGFLVARACLPTPITPNHLTLASIATGLLGAALSASTKRSLRIAGALLGVAYGVLDCADGQLARARGTSSRTGRILDGASDYIVGVATGAAVAKNLGRTHGAWGRWLAIAGVTSVVVQGTLFDHAKNRYLSRTRAGYREGDDLAETLEELERLRRDDGPLAERALLTVYSVFLRLQSTLGGQKHAHEKRSAPSRRDGPREHEDEPPPTLEGEEAARLGDLAKQWAWLGPSTHVALLGAFVIAERLDLYAWLRLVPGNVWALALRRASRAVERGERDATWAAWAAFARVALPSGAVLPAAGDATVARVVAVLRSAPAPLALAFRALLTALNAHALARHFKPFTALDEAEQTALLRAWHDGGFLPRAVLRALIVPLKAAHFDGGELHARLGCVFEQHRPTELQQPPAIAARTHSGRDLASDQTITCDVVVIGTGAGGAVVGKELAEAGCAVVLLEQGKAHDRRHFSGRPFAMQRALYRRSGATFSVGNTLIPIPLGQTVGGSTTVNSGTCFRAPDRVLSQWQAQLGLNGFEPSVFAKHYGRVEAVLGVARARTSLLGGSARVIARGADALGFTRHGPLRRNAPDCDGKGVCCFGCPTDAKRSTNVSYVPMAQRAGAELFADCDVERILLDDGRATGVIARAASGRSLTVHAKAVVVAGGAIMTPVLLEKNGLARASGQLGRNLSIHPCAGLLAAFDERIAGWDGIPQGYGIEDLVDDGILFEGSTLPLEMTMSIAPHWGRDLIDLAERFDRIASFGFQIEDDSRGAVRSVRGEPWITYSVNDSDLHKIKRGVATLARLFFAAGASRVHAPVAGFETLRSPADVDRFTQASLRARDFDLTAYHPLGTARMGRDPRTSVVDTDHQVHGVPGLYVVDGSVLPSSLGVNPQVTIMAVATRAAERIAARL